MVLVNNQTYYSVFIPGILKKDLRVKVLDRDHKI